MPRVTPSFQLPKDAAIYTPSIFDRCRLLVAYNVWSGIQQHRLDAWIGNFRTEEERYFAAKVLDSLIYRSKDQTVALMRQLFQRAVPDLERSRSISPSLRNVYDTLRCKTEPNVRVVPVLLPSAPPIKSGGLMGRYLRRTLKFQSDWITDSTGVLDFLSDGKAIIFFDDFLGTGNQFAQYVHDAGLTDAVESGKCIYAPLVAHQDGLKMLSDRFPLLGLCTAEKLDERHALFHADAGSFPDDENTVEAARDFYYCLLNDRKIEVNKLERRGFGYFDLVYAFEDAVPDNSLPILWWSDSPSWQPLFDR